MLLCDVGVASIWPNRRSEQRGRTVTLIDLLFCFPEKRPNFNMTVLMVKHGFLMDIFDFLSFNTPQLAFYIFFAGKTP